MITEPSDESTLERVFFCGCSYTKWINLVVSDWFSQKVVTEKGQNFIHIS